MMTRKTVSGLQPVAGGGLRGKLIALVGVVATSLVLLPGPASAELLLPPGFTAQVYVTGEGFDANRGVRGIPSTSTLAFDAGGFLYLARTGRRYTGGEGEDLWPIYRIPPGGARLSPNTEGDYLYGPPLPNAQVAGIRAGRELFVTTFNRDRRVGVLYRMLDRRAEWFAGGTPLEGRPPLVRQPEGVAVDGSGNIYVADRDAGVVLKLDPSGGILDPRYASLTRPRVLAMDDRGELWIGADGAAEVPWQRGPGEIWKVSAGGTANLVLRGPMPAGLGFGPGGRLFVADRHAAQIFFLDSEGKRVEFAAFTEGDAPRSLTFAPAAPGTRQAGIAGDLFVITIARGAWPINEIIRISGPFEEFVRGRAPGR